MVQLFMNNKIKILAEYQYIFNFVIWSILVLILIVTVGIPTLNNLWLISLYAVPVIGFAYNTPRFIAWVYAKSRVKHDAKKQAEFYQCRRVSVTDGEPGTGKTSSNIFNAKNLAEYNWHKLQIEYALLSPFARQIENGKDVEKKRHWKEVKEAFEFWAKHSNLQPCLMSSVPLIDFKGRKTLKLTQAHIEQKKKSPYLSVWFEDEIGMSNPADGKRGKNKNLNISEAGRFIRHHFDGFWLNTDQDSGNIAIDLKRVVALNRTMLEQKAFLKPLVLMKIYNFLCNRLIAKFKDITEKNYNCKVSKARSVNKKHIKFLLNLNYFIKASGFRIYRFIDKGNKIKANPLFKSEETKLKTQYVPSLLNCRYDDRCFANSYKAKDFSIEEKFFENLILSESELLDLMNNNLN